MWKLDAKGAGHSPPGLGTDIPRLPARRDDGDGHFHGRSRHVVCGLSGSQVHGDAGAGDAYPGAVRPGHWFWVHLRRERRLADCDWPSEYLDRYSDPRTHLSTNCGRWCST